MSHIKKKKKNNRIKKEKIQWTSNFTKRKHQLIITRDVLENIVYMVANISDHEIYSIFEKFSTYNLFPLFFVTELNHTKILK